MIEATTPELINSNVTRYVALPVKSADTRDRLTKVGAIVNPIAHLHYVSKFMNDVRMIQEVIRMERIDIVEIFGLFVLQAAIAAKLERKRLVWQLHSDIGPKWLRTVMGKVVSNAADVVMTSGRGLIRTHGGLGAISHEVIPFSSPVDLSKFAPDGAARQHVREHYGFNDNDVVVGTLGNRTWQKRHELLIEVASVLGSTHQNLKFLIVGSHVQSNSGYYRREVEDLALRVNAVSPGRVTLDTQHFSASDLMNAFDVFALTSVAEGASLVTAEAMATGKPAVVSDVGSLSDLVVPGVTGYLVPGKARYFHDAFVSLMDPELRSEFGESARQLISLRRERPAEALLRAYERVMWPRERATHYYAFIIINERTGTTESKLFRSIRDVKTYARKFLADPNNEPPMTSDERVRFEDDLSKINPMSGVAVRPCDAWKMAVVVAPVIDSPSAIFSQRGTSESESFY